MRTLLAAGVAGLALAAARADDPKPKADPPAKPAAPKQAEPSLKVGDKAPVLKADKWLQGAAVPQFEPGKVYVVEFWQTWCGPCIVMMPHLADLAEEYAPKGVTVIGYAAVLNGDTPERVGKFVEKRGPKLGYTFANSADMETYNAWMKAAGQNGIPCSFVVDREGTIRYIGHPVYLDEVLPKVLGGTWTPAEDAALKADEKAYEKAAALAGDKGPAEQLAVDAEWAAKRPCLVNNPYSVGPNIGLRLKAKKLDEAKALAEATIAKAARRDDATALNAVATALRAPAARADKGLVGVAVKAAEAGAELAGGDSPAPLLGLADAYDMAGDKEKATAARLKAVGVAEKAVKDDKDFRGLLGLAAAHAAGGDKDKAKAAAGRAVAATAGQPDRLRQAVAQQAKRFGYEEKPEGEKKDK